MAPRLRPTLKDFQRFGWVPDPVLYAEWKGKLDRDVSERVRKLPAAPSGIGLPYFPDASLCHPVQKFREFIESNPDVSQEFERMFEEKNKVDPEIPKNYLEMLMLWDEIVTRPPPFGDLGPPMYMIMAKIMNTQGGFSAFTKSNLNYHFKEMVKSWQDFLVSPDSRQALDAQAPKSWLSEVAVTKLLADFDGAKTLDQVFECDTTQLYFGFTSFEHFFNRKFTPDGVKNYRPFGVPDDQLKNIISSPCEAVFYERQENVSLESQLWIKDEEYSLKQLLANDELAPEFVGGSVYQTFLQPTGYHRWHAPVDGTIVKIIDVPGTYFAQSPAFIGDELYFPPPGEDMGDKPAHPYLRSLAYFSHCAARQLIFIQCDNADIGLLCFVAIGMTEISTCETVVRKNQHVNRGDELGMFHFGGSSCSVVARKTVTFTNEYDHVAGQPAKVVPIHRAIGFLAT